MARRETSLWFDLDLAVMEDEALIVLAKECEYAPARDEMIERYRDQTNRHIGWLAYRYRLSNADSEDARQNSVFWIIEAITKYDTNQIGKPRGCSFRSFIHRVLIARFKDFAKHLRRVEGHYERTIHCAADESSEVAIDRTMNDPASIAEAHESISCFQKTISGLDAESSRLWRLLADGKSLRQIAAELDVSYDSIKRRRRKLIAQLKSRLTQFTGAAAFADNLGGECAD